MAFFRVLRSETKEELVLPPVFVRQNFDPSFVMKRITIIYNMSKYWNVTLRRISKIKVVICDGWKEIVQELRLTKLTMLVFTPFLPFADWMLSAYDRLYAIVNEPHKRIVNLCFEDYSGDKMFSFCYMHFFTPYKEVILPNMFVSDHVQQDKSKVLYKLISDEDYVREVVVEKIGDEFCFTEGFSKVIEDVGLEFLDFVHFQYIGVKSFKMTIFNPNGTQRKIKKSNEAEQGPSTVDKNAENVNEVNFKDKDDDVLSDEDGCICLGSERPDSFGNFEDEAVVGVAEEGNVGAGEKQVDVDLYLSFSLLFLRILFPTPVIMKHPCLL